MRGFRRRVAAVVCSLLLAVAALPQLVMAEDGLHIPGEIHGAGERSMLSVVGIGILCAGGLTVLITTGGKRKQR